jgi:hypothetical protein
VIIIKTYFCPDAHECLTSCCVVLRRLPGGSQLQKKLMPMVYNPISDSGTTLAWHGADAAVCSLFHAFLLPLLTVRCLSSCSSNGRDAAVVSR